MVEATVIHSEAILFKVEKVVNEITLSSCPLERVD
jgi:hypothetical protein